MTGGPLADLLAVAMVGVACFHLCRLALAGARRWRTEVDVDIVHTLMGVSMAGMLTGWLTGAWNDVWIVAFGASAAWFGRGLVRHVSDAGAAAERAVHHLPHFVASAVMLYMLVAMPTMSMSMAGARAASASSGAGSLLLASVLAVLVVVNAAIAAGRELLLVPRVRSTIAAKALVAGGGPVSTVGTGLMPESQPAYWAPRMVPACLFVMSLAMAYMLVTARP